MKRFLTRKIISVGIVVAGLIVLITMITVETLKERNEKAKNACINNLRLIDSRKLMWAMEFRKKATDIPTEKDFWDEFYEGPIPKAMDYADMPCCPDDPAQSFKTSYQLRSVRELPVCLIDPKNHVLPPRPWVNLTN